MDKINGARSRNLADTVSFLSVTGNCTAGQMSEGKTCKACPLGTYQDRKWQTECKRCGDNMTTSRTGATTVRDCFCKCFVFVFTLKCSLVSLEITYKADKHTNIICLRPFLLPLGIQR